MNDEIIDARKAFGSARWIWPNVQGYDVVNYFMQARRTFSLDARPRRCVVRVTADSRYKLLVNGRHVCAGPARGFQSHWPYDEVNIAPFLKRGANCVAMLVHSYGRGTYQYVTADTGAAILSGKAGRVDISTGPEWRVRRAPGYKRHTTVTSLQTGYEEFFDARVDDGRWVLPTYKERSRRPAEAQLIPADSFWKAGDCRVAGCMPWHYVEPRGIPMLDEREIAPKTLVAECEGRSSGGWRDADNLTAAYLRDKRAWREAGSILKRALSAAEFRVPPAGRGRFRSYIVDFGREVVGCIRLEVAGAAGGEVVDTQVFETITGVTPDINSPYFDCKMAFANRLTLARGVTSHEQFEHWGFRYLIVTVRESARPLAVRIGLRSALYPLDVKAAFQSSDRRLNDIYRISVRAQQCCMIDAYVDCPWREQAQWWGDARVQAANTLHLSSDARILKRGIRNIAGQEAPNGLTYGMTPTMAHHCILPDYTLTWVMTLWDYYYETGDKSLVAEQAERMRRALSYFRDMTAPNGLVPYDDRYWLFLDWADIFKEGYSTVYNMFYFMTLETAAALYSLIGDRREAADCAKLARALRAAIMKRLFDAKRGAFYGGLDWKGRPVRHDTPHTYALAIIAGLCPERDVEFVNERLLPVVRGEFPLAGSRERSNPVFGPGTTPSPFFMYYVFQALKAHGRKAEVVECIRRWWGEFVKWGVSTTPEIWAYPGGHSSACHAWSAHPIVHFHNIILGVTQSALAWKCIDFEPVFVGGSASGKVSTPLGEVEAAWKREGNSVEVSLAVPEGMTARVKLPGVRKSVGFGRYLWTVKLK